MLLLLYTLLLKWVVFERPMKLLLKEDERCVQMYSFHQPYYQENMNLKSFDFHILKTLPNVNLLMSL